MNKDKNATYQLSFRYSKKIGLVIGEEKHDLQPFPKSSLLFRQQSPQWPRNSLVKMGLILVLGSKVRTKHSFFTTSAK